MIQPELVRPVPPSSVEISDVRNILDIFLSKNRPMKLQFSQNMAFFNENKSFSYFGNSFLHIFFLVCFNS